jgi:hypothetical protein
MGAAVCSGKFRRSTEATVPVAARGLVAFEAGMSWMMVLFLLSKVTASMVPLLVVALVMGRLEFVEGLGDEVGRVELDLLVCLALSQRNFCCGSFFLG